MQAALLTKGATLTEADVTHASEAFRKQWEDMGDHDVFQEAYQGWRHSEPAAVASMALRPYEQMWGGGCRATPTTKEELFEYHRLVGWPTDEQVLHFLGLGVAGKVFYRTSCDTPF